MGILYSSLKAFHFLDRLDNLAENNDKIVPPIHIRIKPTNICNHSCWYCAYRLDGLQLGRDMVDSDSIPRSKMLEIVDDINEMGVRAITFSGGGDPFCYRYLLSTAEKLSQTNIKFAALTNGGGLKGEVARIFATNATWLRVSMDGWDDTSYSTYRKVKDGEYTRIMHNMENFQKFGGGCHLGVSLIIDKDNASHIYESAQRLKCIGINSIKMSPCVVSNSGEENRKYHQPVFNLVREQINRVKADLIDNQFEMFDAYHELADKFTKDYTWCPRLQILPVIGADLNVYSCQDKAYNLSCGLIGSIKDKKFSDFWFDGKGKFFQINPSIHCNHHCVANSINKLIIEYSNLDREHIDFI